MKECLFLIKKTSWPGFRSWEFDHLALPRPSLPHRATSAQEATSCNQGYSSFTSFHSAGGSQTSKEQSSIGIDLRSLNVNKKFKIVPYCVYTHYLPIIVTSEHFLDRNTGVSLVIPWQQVSTGSL